MLVNDEHFVEETISFIEKANHFESSTYPCTECPKICISKGGLTRHTKRKYPQSLCEKNEDVTTATEILPPEKLKIFIGKTLSWPVLSKFHTQLLFKF